MLDLFSFRRWLGGKIFPSLGPSCVRVSPNRIIKGPTLRAEADALLFVAENTSIRVPKVHRLYDRPNGFYIEMEYVRGRLASRVWASLTTGEKDRIVRQLAEYIRQLRQLEAKDTGIGSVTNPMGPVKDLRLSDTPFGPFADVDEFHTFVRKNMPPEKTRETFGDEVFDCHHSSSHKVVMSHADLGLRNMIVDSRGDLVLIDWEFAGWWPEYWEYSKTFYVMFNPPEFYELLKKHFVNYEKELQAERRLWNILDQPWSYD